MFFEVAPVLLVQLHTELVDDRALQVRSLTLCVKDNSVARILLNRSIGALAIRARQIQDASLERLRLHL